ncbi:MAG TPA: hypothetical protein VGF75_07200 [Candidatus Saccharimonadales bacterium]|jgi:hypothetical protein
MSKLLEQVDSLLDGTVTVHNLNEPFDDHDKLITVVSEAELTLSSLFPQLREDLPNPVLDIHPTIRHDQQEAVRDPVSSEYVLHFDGSCEPIRPSASLVVAREAGLDASPTRFVSTAGFFALASEQGIFRNFDATDVDSIFGYSAYYSQTQALWLALEPNNERLKEVVRNDLARDKVDSRDELINKLDADPKRGKRKFPLIAPHSITGADSIMIDAGVRHIGLASRATGTELEVDQYDLDVAFINLRLLLADTPRLEAEGITAKVTPKTGFGVAFTKEGLHNQEPSSNEKSQLTKRRMSVLGLVEKAS